MLGYTGEVHGQTISVMGTGMGLASIGIYASELIDVYGVRTLIRLGSCGALQEYLQLGDIIVGTAAGTTGDFPNQFLTYGHVAAMPDGALLEKLLRLRQATDRIRLGGLLSSEYFYHTDPDYWRPWANLGYQAVEMEAYALYTIAAYKKVAALSICTISDSLVTGEGLSAEDRVDSFHQMMEIGIACLLEP